MHNWAWLADINSCHVYDHLNGVNFSLAIHSKSDSSGISYTKANKDYFNTYAQTLKDNMRMYPRLLIAKSRIEVMLVCSGLAYRGEARAAIPDFRRRRLLLDVDYAQIDKEYSLSVIHHDFFHLVDFFAFKRLYRDKEWEILNDASFVYTDSDKTSQRISYSFVTAKSVPGFVTPYATWNVAEDKAETFCHLIVNYASLLGRIATDYILATKVNCIKQRLNRLCPEMDESFWQCRKENDFWLGV